MNVATTSASSPSTRIPPRVDAAPPCVVIAVAADEPDDVLRRAGARARRWQLPIRLCAVIDAEPGRADLVRTIAERLRRVWPDDRTTAIDVRVGDRVDQILACADEHAAALLVLGPTSHREGLFARIFAPSVPTSVMRAATCPVVLARGDGDDITSPDILVATDLGDPGWPTLRAAAAEVARTGGRVTVLHCIEPMAVLPPTDMILPQAPQIDDTEATAMALLERAVDEAGLTSAELRVEVATAGAAILAHARTLGVGLVILGTHGRRGAQRLLLGSTAEDVARDATCDVMVVRLRDERAAI
ncbi:MAG: universal stress protein [Deltaproteobacteria bacterium]|nr:universal stress protein [Deltaproteobacteria bacterium]